MNESMINSSLLRKAIVGLKQSSRACFDKFSKVVSAYGLKQTEARPATDLIGSFSVKVVGFRGPFARIQIIPLGRKQE